MTNEYALRLAEQWAAGQVCTLRDGEAEYHKACAAALRKELEAQCNDPLTIDELREMDGEFLWIEENESYWALAWLEEGGMLLIHKSDPDDYGAFSLYGSTWLAYRRKPEVEE